MTGQLAELDIDLAKKEAEQIEKELKEAQTAIEKSKQEQKERLGKSLEQKRREINEL